MPSNVLDVPARLIDDVVSVRRDLHMHPELGFEEIRTAGIVAERLKALGYEVRTGIGQTGVVGILRTRKPGRTILLRADMDGLPVEERSDVGFASVNRGTMHACGHDGHVAILLGAAEMIAERRDLLCGTIVLCFQPAEEGCGSGPRPGRMNGAGDPSELLRERHHPLLHRVARGRVRRRCGRRRLGLLPAAVAICHASSICCGVQ